MFLSKQLDMVVNRETRQKAYFTFHHFAMERPLLTALVLTQFAFIVVPVFMFVGFVMTAVSLSIGLALLSSLFWVGLSSFVAVPAVLLASCAGLLLFVWCAAAFFIVRAAYRWAFAAEKEKPVVDGVKGDEAARLSSMN